ncbi:hypothetical protein Goarm_021719, partial [Gossypium armourianum]|nr:hypothetical protein [Gossypium armourianum]
MENDLARLRIEKDKEVWQFNGEGEKNTSRYEHCLVGCFLTTSVVHFSAMRNNMWHPLGGVLISDLGENRYSCKFYQKLGIDRVINGAPWTFNNHLLLFHQLGENENPLEVSLDKRRGKELEMGCDLSLRANLRKATTVTSVLLREDDNEDFLGFWRYGQWFGKEGGEGRRVEFTSRRDLIEHDAKDNLMEECEGKKRPRDGQHILNDVDLAETISSNEQQDSSNYHKISTAASGQTDR